MTPPSGAGERGAGSVTEKPRHYDDDPIEGLTFSDAMRRVKQARDEAGRDIWFHVTNCHWTKLLLMRWHNNGRFWEWQEEAYGDGFGHCAIITPGDAGEGICNLIAPGDGEEMLRAMYPEKHNPVKPLCSRCSGMTTVSVRTKGLDGRLTMKSVPCPSCGYPR